ncbi:MAG: hypothetical protein ABIO70_35310 [Pseudomonadota bacterium]
MRLLTPAWHALTRPRGRVVHPRHAGWRRAASARRRRESESGVALLMVVGAIMIVTVLVAEMNYGARVRLLLAAHQTEEVQAYWLARTGVNIYRLILAGNMALKNSSIADYGAMFGVNIGDALWQAVPFISTGLMRMLFVSGGDVDDFEDEDLQQVRTEGTVSDEIAAQSREKAQAGHFGGKNFLDFDGDFNASIVDEDRKVNLNGFASRQESSSLQTEVTATSLYGLMSGQENDQWFYDRNIDRWEIIGNVADWVDRDSARCGLRSGYEDDLYNRYDDDYLAKNAPFDSKEEVRLVAGWEGEVYERYQDRVTVWGSGKINVNTADREVVAGLLRAYIQPQPADSVIDGFFEQLQLQMGFSSFQSAQEFVEFIENNTGFTVSDEMKNVVSTSSSVFTITSMGVVGDTTVTITAVLDYSQGGGSMKYWHVD